MTRHIATKSGKLSFYSFIYLYLPQAYLGRKQSWTGSVCVGILLVTKSSLSRMGSGREGDPFLNLERGRMSFSTIELGLGQPLGSTQRNPPPETEMFNLGWGCTIYPICPRGNTSCWNFTYVHIAPQIIVDSLLSSIVWQSPIEVSNWIYHITLPDYQWFLPHSYWDFWIYHAYYPLVMTNIAMVFRWP